MIEYCIVIDGEIRFFGRVWVLGVVEIFFLFLKIDLVIFWISEFF